MKVGILIPRQHGGGAEFVALEWAGYLRHLGHDVVVITTHGGHEPPEDAVVALSARSFLPRLRQLSEHVRTAKYDVLLSLMPHWNVLALLSTAARRQGSPAVIISGRNAESALRQSQGLTYRLELLLAQLLYRRADAYVAISHPVAAEAASAYGIDLSRIWVVPNPSTAKTRGSVRRSDRGHGPPNGRQTVSLTLPARLVLQKRPQLAVETAAILRSDFDVDASVDYFGSGQEEANVLTVAERLGVRVSFRGWVPRWFEHAARDAVVLLPSSAEGFGNVLVEAAALGIASVASSRALGVADAIVPNITGVLAMGSGPADFAAAVVEAMRLTPVSAPAWLNRFSAEESGSKLLEVLTAQLRGNAATAAPIAAEVVRSPSPQKFPASPPPVILPTLKGDHEMSSRTDFRKFE